MTQSTGTVLNVVLFSMFFLFLAHSEAKKGKVSDIEKVNAKINKQELEKNFEEKNGNGDKNVNRRLLQEMKKLAKEIRRNAAIKAGKPDPGETASDSIIFDDVIYNLNQLKDMKGKEKRDKRQVGWWSYVLWPEARVHWTYSSSIASESLTAFRESIADYEAKTCLRFTEYAPGSSLPSDYIELQSESGCWSYIGYRGQGGGKQLLNLQGWVNGYGCALKGIAIHELKHALGWFHEHTRADRDSYVQINLGNVLSGYESNFNKQDYSLADGTPYDYDSIMHYGAYSFSSNGQKTIESPQAIGQRDGFSSSDLCGLNKMYNCDVCDSTNPCDPKASCTNTETCPLYSCACNPGYFGDGFTCTPVPTTASTSTTASTTSSTTSPSTTTSTTPTTTSSPSTTTSTSTSSAITTTTALSTSTTALTTGAEKVCQIFNAENTDRWRVAEGTVIGASTLVSNYQECCEVCKAAPSCVAWALRVKHRRDECFIYSDVVSVIKPSKRIWHVGSIYGDSFIVI